MDVLITLLILVLVGLTAFFQVSARRHRIFGTSLPREEIHQLLRDRFSGWRWQSEIVADNEYRFRPRFKGSKAPTLGASIEPTEEGGVTPIQLWVAHWYKRYGAMEHAQYAWRVLYAFQRRVQAHERALAEGG